MGIFPLAQGLVSLTNMSEVAEQSQVHAVEMALLPSISTSEKLLRQIAALLFILVMGLMTVFGYFASSICITVVLAAFLAILFDPLVVKLERLHLPRALAAAVVVLAGIALIGLLGYNLYGRAVGFTEELPVYTSKIQQTTSNQSPGGSKKFSKPPEPLRTTCGQSRRFKKFACRKLQPGLPFWCVERGLLGAF